MGRICCDTQGKLNDKSILLEMSKDTAWKNRARLAVDAIPTWSLFPGQMVAVEGTNSTGAQFDLTNLVLVCNLCVCLEWISMIAQRDIKATSLGSLLFQRGHLDEVQPQ